MNLRKSDVIAFKDICRKRKVEGFKELLQDFLEDVSHNTRVLKLSIAINHFVISQKQVCHSIVIVDEKARLQWTSQFGDCASVPFQSVLTLCDGYFSRNGECGVGECSNSTYFSWYRNEGAWAKCDLCVSLLKSKLEIKNDKDQVLVHVFAKFCGMNLMVSLKQLIKEAHPPYHSGEFQLVDPWMHFEDEHDEHGTTEEKEETDNKRALKYNRVVFVGNSDHLAELHNTLCRSLRHIVKNIDWVESEEMFLNWLRTHSKEIQKQKGNVMVVSDCQRVKVFTDELDGSDFSEELIPHLVMNDICQAGLNRKMGLSILCCPFLSHGSELLAALKELTYESALSSSLLSSDGCKLVRFIENRLSKPCDESSSKTLKQEVKKTKSRTSKRAEQTL
jgi:hypothetical protein